MHTRSGRGASREPSRLKTRPALNQPTRAASPRRGSRGKPQLCERAAGSTNRREPMIGSEALEIAGGIERFRSIYRVALNAVAELPVRALLTTGKRLGPSVLGAIPPNVHVEAWVPQRDVLPRAAALVCHGGSGTLLGGLAAGLPMVVAGVGADQPHNGRLVARAGAGLAVTWGCAFPANARRRGAPRGSSTRIRFRASPCIRSLRSCRPALSRNNRRCCWEAARQRAAHSDR